jgi:hypothetical protein
MDRQRAQEEDRIDQPVDVVGHQHHGPAERQALLPHDLDAAEKDAQNQAQEGLEQGVEP